MKKSILAALTMCLLAGALVIQAPPAHADTFAGVAECQVGITFPNPGGGTAVCSGTLVGAIGVGLHGGAPVTCLPSCPFTANVANYTEPCPIPGLPAVPPLVGTANGSFTAGSAGPFGFTWVRIGLTAVLVPALGGESAGVAAFVPIGPLGTCQAPLPLTAQVVGVAAGDNLL